MSAPHKTDVHTQASMLAATLQAHEAAVRYRRPLRGLRVAVDADLQLTSNQFARILVLEGSRADIRGSELRSHASSTIHHKYTQITNRIGLALLSGSFCSSRRSRSARGEAILQNLTGRRHWLLNQRLFREQKNLDSILLRRWMWRGTYSAATI